MIASFSRPADVKEALRLKDGQKNPAWLAGGTYLLSGACREARVDAISVENILPSGISISGNTLRIGAMTTFQDLLDSPHVPDVIKKAARGMTNRIVRNRATVGGNVGANKSCSSLVSVFIVLDAEFELAKGGTIGAADYADAPGDLVFSVNVPVKAARKSAYGRWARVSCDLSVITAAVSADVSGGVVSNLKIACGGMSRHSMRFKDIETLFEGGKVPSREEMDTMIEPLFKPLDDHRASAEFKRFRAARMVSDALAEIGGTR